MIKQLLVLPGADAGKLACPNETPSLPSISRQPDVQMMEADGPYKVSYQIPYDAECEWQETGKMWYDIYTQQLKVCHSGTWKAAKTSQAAPSNLIQPVPQLDYFVEHQQVVGPAPSIDIHVFTIPGEGLFVVMANYNNHQRKQKSMMFKWENESLLPYQNISTYSPSSWTSFQIGRHFYLAVTNMQKSSTQAVTESVVVYKWHTKKKKFKFHQDLPSSVPRDVEYFEINGNHYLAVANHRASQSANNTSYNYSTRSFIWKFEKDEKLFREFQKIPTVGAWDWTYFSTLSQSGDLFHFLVVANTINSKQEVQLESKIYYWNQLMAGGLGNFEEYNQNIPTSGATDFEHFEIDGESYLAVANSIKSVQLDNQNGRHSTVSVIYKANKFTQRFDVFQEISTYGIIDWEYFTIGNDSYLIASNQRPGHMSDETTNQLATKETTIYRWKGTEKFVPSNKIEAAPAADWEVIQDGRQTYLIYANGAGATTQIYRAKLR
ncbi:tspear [Bugula neritina]|uniref:Tspear n=1 Tax=Bugula neritina TaxID=10212 RepID=A0A7J7IYG8_BUGNE|nr:tspear [Bugula neritina]